MESNSNIIRTCYIGDEGPLKALQWTLERRVRRGQKYQLFRSSLRAIQQGEVAPDEIDIAILSIDLGQPLPRETLKQIQESPGICLFTQPTPQQLLDLSEFPMWTGIAWDGASADAVVDRMESWWESSRELHRARRFSQHFALWLERLERQVAAVEWLNPPPEFPQSRFDLDPRRKIFTIGGLESQADLRLPLLHTGVFIELRHVEGEWRFQHQATAGLSIEAPETGTALEAGSSFVVGDYRFLFRPARLVEEAAFLARSSGIPTSGAGFRVSPQKLTELGDLCRETLISGQRGELLVRSASRSGAIVFNGGYIVGASSGPVNGEKALWRIMAWSDAKWHFNAGSGSEKTLADDLHLKLGEFEDRLVRWRKRHKQVQPFYPSLQLKLHSKVPEFNVKTHWTQREYAVFAAVCEFRLVRDILNNCPLMDVDVVEGLVELRKQKLIEPRG